MNMTVLYFAAGLASSLLLSWAGFKAAAWQRRRTKEKIAHAVVAYFKKSDVDVHAFCHHRDAKRYVVLIETQPLKKFRFSHIIELSLIEHIQRTCGREVYHVFWRFPLPRREDGSLRVPGGGEPRESSREAETPAPAPDLVAENAPTYKVDEVSWETYTQVITPGAGATHPS